MKNWRFYTCFFLCSFKLIHANLIGGTFAILSNHYDTVSMDSQKIITTIAPIVNLAVTFTLSFVIDKFKFRHIIIPTYILCLAHV